MRFEVFDRRWRIWETNYGRTSGWLIELEGIPIVELSDPIMLDMFWDSYEMLAISCNAEIRAELFNKKFWGSPKSVDLVWRSREFGDQVNAFPALSPFPEPKRLAVRGLYIPFREPRAWETLVLWVRKKLV